MSGSIKGAIFQVQGIVSFQVFWCFIQMLHMFHLDVVKIDLDVAIVIHVCCKCMFQMFQLFLEVCCKCVF
jgi:hypothetical protein